jgi:hypothetical protein
MTTLLLAVRGGVWDTFRIFHSLVGLEQRESDISLRTSQFFTKGLMEPFHAPTHMIYHWSNVSVLPIPVCTLHSRRNCRKPVARHCMFENPPKA